MTWEEFAQKKVDALSGKPQPEALKVEKDGCFNR